MMNNKLWKWLQKTSKDIKDDKTGEYNKLQDLFAYWDAEKDFEKEHEDPLYLWVRDNKYQLARVKQDYEWSVDTSKRLRDLFNYDVIYVTDWVDFDFYKKEGGGPGYLDICIGYRNYNPFTWLKYPYHYRWIFTVTSGPLLKEDDEEAKKYGWSNAKTFKDPFDIDAKRRKYFKQEDVVRYTREFIDKWVPNCKDKKIVFVHPDDWDKMGIIYKVTEWFRLQCIKAYVWWTNKGVK